MKDLLKSLRGFINDDLIYQIVLVAGIIILSYIVARMLSYFAKAVVRPLVKKTETLYDDQIVEALRKAVTRLLFIGGIYFSISVFRQGFGLISQGSKRKLIEEYPSLYKLADYSETGLYIILVVVIVLTLFKIITLTFDWYGESIKAQENKNLYGSLFPLLKKVAKILVAGVALVVILAKIGIDVSAFVVSLGVGSLAVALAAQETLSNMISGLIIMTDRPFRLGDRIKIGTDIHGDVAEIGIRSTKIQDFDRNLIIIPNNDIVKSRIINLSFPNNMTRVLIEIGVVYGTDIDKLRACVIDLIKDVPLVAPDPKPELALTRFADSSVLMRLDVKTENYSDAWGLGCNLREIIYKGLNENGFQFAFPTQTVYLKKDS